MSCRRSKTPFRTAAALRGPPARSLPAAALGACVLALAVPAGAEAKWVIAPPGNSGVEQYVEVVPGSEGNVPVGQDEGHHGSIPSDTRKRLEAAGAEGRAALSFAQATGVGAASRHARRRAGGGALRGGGGQGSGATGGGAGPQAPPRSPHTAAVASDGGGIGPGLPVALAVVAIGALLAALIRRRLR